ncbi:hypothetical protein ACFFNY_19740 [Paenibacillus hodogayensis]|uniref:Zinc ribbon domain-containing protein n=1 Tax=Paenibacillus hodogayensis TaxID=279208 RepID=A0ABV5VZU6_9BACL
MKYLIKPKIPGYGVVLMFFIFFPIGLLMLIIRAVQHRHANHLKTGDLKLLAAFLMGIWFLLCTSFLALTQGEGETAGYVILVVVFSILFALPAFSLWIVARLRTKALEQTYGHYEMMIMDQHMTSVDVIAQSTHQNPATVMTDLNRMIHLGRLPGATLYENPRRIIVAGRRNRPEPSLVNSFNVEINQEFHFGEPQRQPSKKKSSEGKNEPAPTHRVTECSGCGAKMSLGANERKVCDYCGTPLK